MPPRDAAGGAPRLAVIALLPLLVHLSTCGDLDPCRLPRIRSPLCRCKCRCGCPTCSHLLLTRTCPTTRLPPRAQFLPELPQGRLNWRASSCSATRRGAATSSESHIL